MPNGFFIAWRKGSGPLPDDGELPEKIELVPFEHDPLPALDIAQNRAKLTLTGAIAKKPINPMRKNIFAKKVEFREFLR